jgi:hypothetical protein
MPDLDPEAPAYDTMLFYPTDANLSWFTWSLQMFFEGDGVATVTVACLIILIWYRLSGSPLDVSAEIKQVEREELWAEHNERFKPKHHQKWLETGPAGGANSWSGTGDNAAIRRDAALGKALPMPASRDAALVASYESSDTVMARDKDGGARMVTDGNNQDANKEEKYRLKLVEALKVTPPRVSYRTVEGLRVCVVGDSKAATVHVVTVHDHSTSYRSGLMQLSTEFVATLDYDRHVRGQAEESAGEGGQIVCFYHVSFWGHDDVPVEIDGASAKDANNSASDNNATSSKDWTMDSLASKLNQVISNLELSRYVLLGEGAGANIIIRAACEEKQREMEDYNSLKKVKRYGGLLTGIVVINAEFNGPNIGEGVAASMGHWLMNHGYLGTALGRFGVQEWVSEDPSYLSDYEGVLRHADVAKYAYAYMHHTQRAALPVSRTRVLGNIPNLVMVGEGCQKAKEAAIRVCAQLDQVRGSGIVPLVGTQYMDPGYATGGGCVLKDKRRREACIESLKLFIEAA